MTEFIKWVEQNWIWLVVGAVAFILLDMPKKTGITGLLASGSFLGIALMVIGVLLSLGGMLPVGGLTFLVGIFLTAGSSGLLFAGGLNFITDNFLIIGGILVLIVLFKRGK